MRLTALALGPLALALALSPGVARAGLVFTLQEVGDDVALTASGSVNTAGLTRSTIWTGQPTVNPGWALLVTDTPTGDPLGTSGDWYKGITGPKSFGGGSLTVGSAGSGNDAFGLDGHFGFLFLPSGYVSGTALSGSVTFAGHTLDSLGVTPGTYTWTWGSGANADTAVLTIPTAVPEPSSLTLPGLVAVGVFCYTVRRRGSLA